MENMAKQEQENNGLAHVTSCKLPTKWGEFVLHGFETSEGQEHIALTMGDLTEKSPLLIRVHSECLTGDALFSLKCDCGFQLETALAAIAQKGRGALLYLRQEGRGIGLINKIKAYALQDQGLDTVQANEALGLPVDSRKFDVAKAMLDYFNIRSVEVMTNNPMKIKQLEEEGIQVVKRIPIRVGCNSHNQHYLWTKAKKLQHWLD